ncbi:MAG: hypothetical protein WCR52_08895 [Bacteroidota bacterium]
MDDFNQNITNKGWVSMQTMLDKEMPLERKRRRRSVLALLFLMLGTCLLTSAGWWVALRKHWIGPLAQTEQVALMGKGEDGSKEVKVQKEDQEKVQNQVQNQNQGQTQNQVQNKYQDQNQGQRQYQGQDQNQVQNQIKQKSQGRNQIQTRIQPRDHRIASNQVKNQSLGAISKSVDVENLFGSEVNPLPYTQTETASVVSDEHVAERLPLPLGRVVRSTNLNLYPPPMHVDAGAVVEVMKPRHVRSLTFGPTIGLSSERFSTLNGATIGTSINWHFAKYWGLRSSLLYSYLRPSPNTRPVASLRAQQYADATGNNNLLDPYGHLIDPQTGMSTEANKVYVPLQRLNRFEAPLMVYGQILKRLRLMAGPTLSYSLSVQADNKVFALDRVVSNSASERDAGKVDALAADEIKRWQLGFQTGIGLRLGDRLELDFLYRINSIRTYSRVLYDYDGSLLEYAPQRSAQINNLTIFTLNGIMFF